MSETREGTVQGQAPDLEAPDLRDSDSGYGKVLGTGVHTLLEDLVQKDLAPNHVSESKVRNHLQSAQEQVAAASGEPGEITSEIVETARAMTNRFLSSPLAGEITEAGRVFAEYPLSTVEKGETVDVRRGVIDLVYEDEDGWHIVDYKTDRVGSDGLPETLGDHEYADQVRQYASAWKDITGEEISSGSLWFADADDRINVV
jgi:ATP-dependent helicase/nuclease subunit A